MIEGRHTEAEPLLDFVNDPSTLSVALQMELSRHLTSGCEECSAVVEVLPSVVSWPPSKSALREALIHILYPQSRAVLPSDHLAALAAFREVPAGFASLVLEEALRISFAASVDRDPVAVGLVRSLLFANELPLSCELLRLSAQNQLHEALLLMSGGVTEAGHILLNVVSLTRGTAARAFQVNFAEAAARLQWNQGDLEGAARTFGLALETLGKRGDPLRQFELHGDLATVQALRGESLQAAFSMTAAREAIGLVKSHGDPIYSTGGLLREATLVFNLARLVGVDPSVQEAAGELEAAAARFETHTDRLTRAHKDLALGRLYYLLDREKSAQAYGRAEKGFEKCQATESLEDIRAEQILAGLDGDLPGAGPDLAYDASFAARFTSEGVH